MLVLGALLTAYALHLDRELEEKWSLRKWNVPSRIYSAPTRLYPGLELTEGDLEATLVALGYRGTGGDRPPAPGEFARSRDLWTIHLRDFDYPEGPFRGHPLEVRLQGGRIIALRDGAGRAEVGMARLEPVEVSAVFDAQMERRSPISLDEVSPELVQAVLAVEDRRFYRHQGLDGLRIVRAAAANLRAGRFVQGGSTLTQQLIKNFYLHHEKTWGRKLREALMAVLFELRHSKEEILQAYLNEVYLGQDGAVSIAGVEEAARHYFSKPAARLDLAEAALLAGLIRAPGLYDPDRHPERARGRRATVLRLMRAQRRVEPAAAERAREAPLPAPRARRTLQGAPYFTDFVLRELRERFSRDALEREGFRIFTTLDPRAQRAAERAVHERARQLEEAHPALRADQGRPRLQAAVVALDPQSGELLALVGGRDWGGSQYNRAVQARRQPGSAFKPFVYLAALEEGRHTLVSPVSDSALTLTVSGREWAPRNYDGDFHGTVSLREALEQSYNLATARLALEVGLERVVGTARRAGIRSPLAAVPSLALGAFEVTPMELATAYATLAAGGTRAAPRSILEVVSPNGEVLSAHDLRAERVLPPGPVYLVNRALQGVLERGTAAGATGLGYLGPAAGKTGTTNGYRDAWFVGYTPALLALAWVGFDDNRSLGLTGAQAALPVWASFMSAYATPSREVDFVPPPDVVTVDVDVASGKLADEACGPWRSEPFLAGTEPTESCERRRPWWRIF